VAQRSDITQRTDSTQPASITRRTSPTSQPSWARRFFGSIWLKMVVFVVLFLLLSTFVFGGTDTRVQDRQVQFLTDAVRRAAVQSYALEGRFPNDIGYLEDNYGLIIDHNSYAVYYESMGDNLLPQIRVIPLNNQ